MRISILSLGAAIMLAMLSGLTPIAPALDAEARNCSRAQCEQNCIARGNRANCRNNCNMCNRP